MRELKFRAWSDKYGMYKVGCLVTEKGTGDFKPDDRNFICVHMLYQPFFIIEQYTGLKDKNGKEIYEGDILKWKHYYGITEEDIETIAKVYWEEKDASFVVGDWLEPLGHLVDEDKVEVIGNIHENNDLLEYIEKDQKTE